MKIRLNGSLKQGITTSLFEIITIYNQFFTKLDDSFYHYGFDLEYVGFFLNAAHSDCSAGELLALERKDSRLRRFKDSDGLHKNELIYTFCFLDDDVKELSQSELMSLVTTKMICAVKSKGVKTTKVFDEKFDYEWFQSDVIDAITDCLNFYKKGCA